MVPLSPKHSSKSLMIISRTGGEVKPVHGVMVMANALSVSRFPWLVAHRNHFPIGASLSTSPRHSACGVPVLSNTVGRNAGSRGMMVGAVTRVVGLPGGERGGVVWSMSAFVGGRTSIHCVSRLLLNSAR